MIKNNISLQAFNTFGIDASAEYFSIVDSKEKAIELFQKWKGNSFLILGGGSNMLLKGDVPGLVMKNEIKGRRLEKINDNEVLLTAGGGENWHELVLWSLEQGLGGLENLSLIPGTLGAAPIQNIGAYGVELKEVFHSLEAVEIETLELKRFNKEDCQFGYRNSIFKNEGKGKYFITSVSMILTTNAHRIETSYGAIAKELENQHIDNPAPGDISNAVIKIRSAKLPDPANIGNSGSFFKNPLVSIAKLSEIQQLYPEAPYYPISDDTVKLPAGWLIEKCGWKGKRIGDAGTYEKQALVLVNHGTASGRELWALAEQIIKDVNEHFGILLKPEVNVI